MNFHTWQDIKNHENVAQNCIQINNSLQKLQDEARKFNSRENLFDIKQSDYSKISTMVKSFQPYSNLWVTANKWFTNIERWMNGDWETLDAVAAEKFVEDSVRIIATVIRFFKERDIEAILKIAQMVKSQLDEFRPKVPVMVALRKKGMTDRHWEQISSKVGFDVKPTDDFTFGKVIDMGLIKHPEVCIEIGEKASKEFNIEMSLNEMESVW